MVQVKVDKKTSPKRKIWSSTILLVTRFRRKQGKYMLQNVWPFDSPKTRGWFRKCYSNILYKPYLKSPSSPTHQWIFQTPKILDFSNSPKEFNTQTCFSPWLRRLSIYLLQSFPSLELSSHRHVHEAPWPPRAIVESEAVVFVRVFLVERTVPKHSMYFVYFRTFGPFLW